MILIAVYILLPVIFGQESLMLDTTNITNSHKAINENTKNETNNTLLHELYSPDTNDSYIVDINKSTTGLDKESLLNDTESSDDVLNGSLTTMNVEQNNITSINPISNNTNDNQTNTNYLSNNQTSVNPVSVNPVSVNPTNTETSSTETVNIKLIDTNLTNDNLTNDNLTNDNLTNVDLPDVSLINDNLTNDNLTNKNLTDVTLDSINLTTDKLPDDIHNDVDLTLKDKNNELNFESINKDVNRNEMDDDMRPQALLGNLVLRKDDESDDVILKPEELETLEARTESISNFIAASGDDEDKLPTDTDEKQGERIEAGTESPVVNIPIVEPIVHPKVSHILSSNDKPTTVSSIRYDDALNEGFEDEKGSVIVDLSSRTTKSDFDNPEFVNMELYIKDLKNDFNKRAKSVKTLTNLIQDFEADLKNTTGTLEATNETSPTFITFVSKCFNIGNPYCLSISLFSIAFGIGICILILCCGCSILYCKRQTRYNRFNRYQSCVYKNTTSDTETLNRYKKPMV